MQIRKARIIQSEYDYMMKVVGSSHSVSAKNGRVSASQHYDIYSYILTCLQKHRMKNEDKKKTPN